MRNRVVAFCNKVGLRIETKSFSAGNESVDLVKYRQALFADIDKVFPEKFILMEKWNHERWDKLAGYLCGKLGYHSGREFLKAYGYTVVSLAEFSAPVAAAKPSIPSDNQREKPSEFAEPPAGGRTEWENTSNTSYSRPRTAAADGKNVRKNPDRSGRKKTGLIAGILLLAIILIAAAILLFKTLSGSGSSTAGAGRNSATGTAATSADAGITICSGAEGQYYGLTYEQFKDELSTAMLYANGGNSTLSIEKYTSVEIDEFSEDVVERKIRLYRDEQLGIGLLTMEVYTTVDEDKVIKVVIMKANVADDTYSLREELMNRFTAIANGTTQLLTGEMIAEYGTGPEFKTKTDKNGDGTHYFIKNGSEVIFLQQDYFSDYRRLTIYPAPAVQESSENASSVPAENDDVQTEAMLTEESPEPSEQAVPNESTVSSAKAAETSSSTLQFPQLSVGAVLKNGDGHTITVTGIYGSDYYIDISIVRLTTLNCVGTITGDRMNFVSDVASGSISGYIQYNGWDCTLVFNSDNFGLNADPFAGFYLQPEETTVDTSFYIGTWATTYDTDGLQLTIDSFDGQYMQGTIYTDLGAIPFSGYFNEGLYASYSYGDYVISLCLFQNEYNGAISSLGIECSIMDQEWNTLYGTTGQTQLYKAS